MRVRCVRCQVGQEIRAVDGTEWKMTGAVFTCGQCMRIPRNFESFLRRYIAHCQACETDWIHWLDPHEFTAEERAYLQRVSLEVAAEIRSR